jgi:redox-sensitive bicupin YhaK (pirin superfamily)
MEHGLPLAIPGRPRDIGGFPVRRVLPAMMLRHVGPFVFFDHMGPTELAPGDGMDVRPHPHIALATITYLFDGEILHKDSIGSERRIRPGDVNWMLAGSGIAHSERTPPDVRERGGRVHGIQSWVALPDAHEEDNPNFEHHPASTLPRIDSPGATLRVLAGSAYGARAPTNVLSPTLYVHARLDEGADLAIDDTHEERAIYAVDAALVWDGETIPAGTMLVFPPGTPVVVRALEAGNAMLIGGASVGPRHIYWNFVSSSKQRIERAKADWQGGRFAKVVGDDGEPIPLPD